MAKLDNEVIYNNEKLEVKRLHLEIKNFIRKNFIFQNSLVQVPNPIMDEFDIEGDMSSIEEIKESIERAEGLDVLIHQIFNIGYKAGFETKSKLIEPEIQKDILKRKKA